MKLTVLGSGTSHGIPVIGCSCPVCSSTDPRDKRMRASLFIQGDRGEQVIIDTGPEFRLQALRAGISALDAVFLTHAHADHVHGLDDVRPLSYEREIPIYGNSQTMKEIEERFIYAFINTQRGGGKPRISLNPVSSPVRIGALTLTPVPVKHGTLDILGWMIQEAGTLGPGEKSPFAVYLTDTSAIPAESLDLIQGTEILIIDGLRERVHETHFSFEQALDAARAIGAHQTYLTHICHSHSHEEIEEYCNRYQETHSLGAQFIAPGFDGLELLLP
ncbi:lipoate-protein ligase B [Treponema primitia ZAS-2]|uniref:Lipoate-protein ligase B n=1 Tax=Treponema primitia (strain ATCC BAA-887 / DSM 12427 / ZAS-2) TaxID=545694 RepID=F5YQU8_TREPZ|nr:MBL fold metallo-hydrolase [Treponema primitia]AEF83933.1 lipoate-protein ligase B [Treponema primitia ZAS-2]